jgi:hypothetical protein
MAHSGFSPSATAENNIDTTKSNPSLNYFNSLVVTAVDSMLRRGVFTQSPGSSWNPAPSRPGTCWGGLSRRLVEGGMTTRERFILRQAYGGNYFETML